MQQMDMTLKKDKVFENPMDTRNMAFKVFYYFTDSLTMSQVNSWQHPAYLNKIMSIKEPPYGDGFKCGKPLSTGQNLIPNKNSSYSMFSTLLGYFPLITHWLIPMKTLDSSMKISTITLDQTWLESAIPKSTSTMHTLMSKLVPNQKGLVKIYFLSFLVSLTLVMLLLTPNYLE